MTPECAALLAKADSKLKTARIDFANGRYDDAVSRAYYAAFHAMSAALLAKGLAFSSHGQVIGAFSREFLKTGVLASSFGRAVQELFADRQIGDYDVFSSIDPKTAERDVREAERLFAAVSRHLESSPG